MSNNLSYPVALILVAAGASTRMGIGKKKEYLPLHNGTVLSEAVRAFVQSLQPECIVIAIPKDGTQQAEQAISSIDTETRTHIHFVEGGVTRQQSVHNAMEFLTTIWPNHIKNDAIVLIHDGARPFVTSKIITDVATVTHETGAAVPALQPVDTQKEIDDHDIIIRHLQRKRLAAVETPQGFIFTPLLEAHRKAAQDNQEYTDDTEIWGKYVGSVHIVPGDSCNKKITYPEDIPEQGHTHSSRFTMIHTGLGYDLHRLVPGRKLLLGGIHLPFEKGEDGHSDGDVLFHAITDALLGASGMGDIGSYFPPSDPQWKDADSAKLLSFVWKQITDQGWKLENLDCVIALEKPKFLPFRDQVRQSIAQTLNVSIDQVFVKAKTGEKVGVIGSGEAVAVWATCLLVR
ncbi:MAG: 2-C-methyl-D-erythritol 2,4-cyclodiphosphate synthase [Treponema sp.]|nr:2-C-methyl-D-erythritol 2,4-cyclodiphosphate synthase [Treponema sp.]